MKNHASRLHLPLAVAAAVAAFASPLRAQVFAPVPALSFTKVFAGANPLPQTLTIASVGTGFNFTVAASTSTGGTWLSVLTGGGCGFCSTPHSLTAVVNAGVTLAAGTYTGQIVLTSQVGAVKLTIPVSLTVAAASTAFFDNLPGQVSFSMKTGGTLITSQDVQIRNGGTSGTLNWTLTKSTSDNSKWLTVSTFSGTAPSAVTIGVKVASLPGGGQTPGSYIGQVAFHTSGSVVTIPVSVVVGDSILSQVNAISFTKVFSGANPLPQTLTIPSTGATFNFTVAAYSATGGSWLSYSTGAGCGFCSTPQTVKAVASPIVTLAAGSYTGEIIITTQAGNMSITVPVTLTVAPSGGTFFDNMAGQMSFSLKTGGATITSQDAQVRNGGSGTLGWTLAASTSDAGSWLTISTPNGIAPSQVTVGVIVANLPGGGLVAGTFIGELVFETAGGGSITVPVSVVVGDSILSQVNGISFTKVFAGPNPLPQNLTVPSTGANFNFTVASYTATGGAWLTAGPTTGCGFCATPQAITASINASPTLAAGTYTGEIVLTAQSGDMSITVPVTLTVAPAGGSYFDNMPGQMSFSFQTGTATGPPAQSLQVRNGGSGSLDWSLTASTSDGGDWLSASAVSGSALSAVSISVNVANLPNAGLVDGTFVGELVFQTSGSSVTVSVSMTVGSNVLRQVNAISFVKPFQGANPLPQALVFASTGSSFNFTVKSSTSTGGNWLTVAPRTNCGFCATPQVVFASINASPTLAAGTYTGQIVITAQSGFMSITVPVTLTVAATGGTFLDNMPGQMSFALLTGTSNDPPAQRIQVRNGGAGALNWTLASSTSDGGNWLSASAATGAAPSTVNVSIQKGNLPGQGLIGGTFTGELVFQSGGVNQTVPVEVVVGTNVLNQVNAISFTMPFGGANPLPQTLTFPSMGSNFNFTVNSYSATGGSWLSVGPRANCGFCATPQTVTAAITASPTLAAGTYTGEIIITAQSGFMSLTVPVTLTVAPAATPFFANVQGQMSFSFVTASGNPASQTVLIRNGGSGALKWTLATSTSDGGNWLTASAVSGTARSVVTIGVDEQFLPNQGLIPGTFVGELVFLSPNNSSVTIPVSVVVGASVFVQANALNFTMPVGGSNPVAQNVNVASSGTNFNFLTDGYHATGGSWLTVTTAGGCGFCATPHVVTATVNGSSLAAGAYTGEIVLNAQSGAMAMTVPVILTVTTAPTSIAATAGTPQSAVVGTAFAKKLAATVLDGGGNPVAGVTVTFHAPASGASGTFAGGVNTAVTGAQGTATSRVFTANSTVGSYTVTATAGALTTSPGFALTNKASAP